MRAKRAKTRPAAHRDDISERTTIEVASHTHVFIFFADFVL
jgi:hypothetical protein